ncbi:MAG: amino acid adenylation domain-containing protein [Gammaproteobacteria bacterium]
MTIRHDFAQQRLSAQGGLPIRSEPDQPWVAPVQLLSLRAQQSPASLAYAFLRDDLSPINISYQQLELRVRDLAARIATRARRGDRALLVYGPGPDPVVAFWACLYAGVVPVPAPSPDALRLKTTLPRLRSLAADARTSIVLASTPMRDAAYELSLNKEAGLAHWMATDLEIEPAKDFRPPTVAASDPAYLQYTSGSTSTPRGVMVTHANVIANCAAFSAMIQPDADTRVLLWLPYFHDYGLVYGIIWPLVHGVPGYLMSPVTFLRRPLRWLEAIERFRISYTGAPNFAYAACARAAAAWPEWHADLSSLRDATCGAEPINPTTLAQFNATFARHGLSPTAFSPAYGLAEATLLVARKPYGTVPRVLTVNASALRDARVERADASHNDALTLVSCGAPAPDTQIAIIDTESGATLPSDRVGEIWLSSASVAAGYWGHNEATHATFERSLPTAPDRRFLRTGDLGFMHGGELYVTGRLKDLVIIHGRNYYPQDIEWTVEHAAPPLRLGHGAAFSIEGEDGERLAVVQEIDRRAQEGDLDHAVRAIRAAVAREHELPIHAVVLVRSGSIARTSSGKIRRSSCKQAFLEGKLSVLRLDVHDPDVAEAAIAVPTAEAILAMPDRVGRQEAIEALVVELIARLTGRDSSDLPLTASAIECGLDSLTTFRLLNEIERALSVALPPSSVLGEASLRGFATRIVDEIERASVSDERPGASVPVQAIERRERMPLGPAQERMWFWDELAPGQGLYNIGIVVRLDGVLDAPALLASLGDIVERHEVLRSRVVLEDGAPLQAIEPAGHFKVARVTLDTSDALAELARLTADEARCPIDLRSGPGVRATLVTLNPESHRLLWTFHHSVCDGWSIGLLLQELASLYDARARGQQPQLPCQPLQYIDYAAWERQRLASGARERELNYWTRQLAGAPTELDLPTDHPRAAVPRFRGASQRVDLGEPLSAAIRALARRSGLTPFMILLAAWQLLLGRYTGRETVLVGTPVAKRNRREFESIVGCFANTLALRADLNEGLTMAGLFEQVRATTLAAYDYQQIPFEEVVNALQLPRVANRSALIQALFTLQPQLTFGSTAAGVAFSTVLSDAPVAKFDVSLVLGESGPSYAGMLEYDADLFEPTTMERWCAHYKALLEEIVARPRQPIDAFEMLSTRERALVIEQWNATAKPYPPDRRADELIALQAQHTPDAVAVRGADVQLTYSELERRSNQLAHHLRRLGVRSQTTVGICLERSPEMIVVLLAVMKAGGAYVPLDPAFPRQRLETMALNARLALLVTVSNLLHVLPPIPGKTLCLDQASEDVARESPGGPVRAGSPEDLAYVLYTSGSTGEPKGVEVPHRALVNCLHSMRSTPGIASHDVLLAVTTLSFDIAGLEIFLPLIAGARVELATREEASDVRLLLQRMENCRPTIMQATPTTWRMLIEAGWSGTPGLTVLCGGDTLSAELAAPLLQRCADLWNLYGPTETTIWSTLERITTAAGLISIGRPIANTSVYILDRKLKPVPPGVRGELYIGGSGLARGYSDRPDLTADRFIEDPYSSTPGARLYRTGDAARFLDDGRIMHLGRLDHQVKIRGYRIELGEIEAALDSHPGITHSVAVAREDQPGVARLVAYYIGDGVEPATLRNHLRERLPEYMIPHALVALDAMPLTPNGKVDRNALPAPVGGTASPERVAPRGPLEQMLWDIWRAVLEHDNFGVNDSFFDLGGHSLSAARAIARLRETLGRDVRLRVLFEAPTIAALAARLQDTNADSGALGNGPIPRNTVSEVSAASYSEEALWFIDRLLGSGPLYNMPYAVSLRGSLDVAALEQSLQALLARHASLRTAFEERDGQVVRVVRTDLAFILSVTVVDGRTAAEREGKLRGLLEDAARAPFDLTRAPLLRAHLLRVSDTEHRLILVAHHIVADGWSIGVLARELSALYRSFRSGTDISLPALPIDYGDYAAWQRARHEDDDVREQLAYWRTQLAGLQALGLPLDRPRPAQMSQRGGVERFEVPGDLLARLEALARIEGVTLFMVLLAAFKTLLLRYCGQDDVAIGTPAAGRSLVAIEGLIGNFVNTLVLRTDLAGNPEFTELLHRVRQTAVSAYSHQDLAFERLVADISPTRSLRHNPLHAVSFALQNVPDLELRLAGLEVRRVPVHSGTSKSDLFLSLTESGGTLEGEIEYSADLFAVESIQGLARHFRTLLAAIVAEPHARLAELPLLDAQERKRVLLDWNDTARAYPPDRRVHELISDQARRTPNARAATFQDRQITYAELDRRSDHLAAHLRERGVGPDVAVGVCAERSIELLIGLLAVLKAGGAYLPLDPEYPDERLKFMLHDAGAPVVLTQQALRARVPQPNGAGAHVLCLDSDWPGEPARPQTAMVTRPEHAAYIIYTSGSTGRPKGVVIPHRGLGNHVQWLVEALRIVPNDRVLQKTAIGFDASVWEFLAPLQAGATLVLAAPGAHRDAGEMARAIRTAEISILQLVPSALRALLSEPSFEACRSLRYVICGGEKLDGDLACEFLRQLPSTTLGNFYGPTEASDDATYYEMHTPPQGPGSVPIGRPIANVRCYLLDAHRQPVPIGAIGEIYIGGAGLARGYLARPDLSAERFVADPFRAGERLFRTGDLARYRHDGVLEYVGRRDHQVKIRGFRIELGEIEAALKACTGVAHCVVLAREDRPGLQRLVAYLVGKDLQADELRARLARVLPDYMIPAALVLLPELPLLPNGKLDRQALPAPEEDAEHTAPVAPRGPVEQALWDIWRDVLRRAPDSVHQSFFELGGHSLLATQVTARARDALQVDLPLRTIFEAPTIAGMATCITELRSRATRYEPDPPIEIVPRGDALPVSFSQRRMWLAQQLEPQGTAYNMSFALRYKGRLDHQALAAAVNQLVHRHEAFRTTFAVANGEPLQVIAPPAPVGIRSIDLSSSPEQDRGAEAARLFREESMRPFDLAQGPLFRFLLVRLGDDDHAMLWLVHHVAGDQWSAGIVSRELALAYRALSRGEPFRLEPLKVQYADFAAWQRRVENAALRGQLDYWREKLHGVPVLALPTDRPRPAARTFAGSYVMTTLAPGTLAALKQMSARQGATPFMMLLACFKLLLARYSAQDDIVVGSPIANRTRVEIEPLVGTFVNTLVLRTDLSGDPTFARLLARVRSTAVDAYAHQDLAFEQLVEELGAPRADGHSPLVQVLFNVPNAPIPEPGLDGLEIEIFDFDSGSVQFDLSLSVETEVYGRVFLSYSTELFDASTANRMLAQYVHLISQAMANPDQPLSAFDIITPDEAALMLGAWNRSDTPYPRERRVDQMVMECAQRSPHALAVVAADARLTYVELDRKANRLAHYLRGLGVGAESPVGICLERTADLIVVLLAVMKAGGAYVPLDPAFPPHRLHAMVEDAGLVLLVTQTDLLHILPPMPGKTLCVQEARDEIAKQPMNGIERPSSPSDLAYILYTSGSTGRPKGVEVEHGALTNFLHSMHSVPGIGANDTLLAVTTLSFDIAGLELYLPLIAGARVELASREEASDPRLLLQRLEQCRPTLMQATPTLWHMLIDAGWEGSPDLTVLCGGEGLPAALATQLLPRCAALWNLYGPTETTIWSTLERITPDPAPISIGRPIHNTSVYVLDRGRKPVPLGVAGELYIGGAGVARGYRSRPDLSAERFVADPYSAVPGARLYRTGDSARFLPDGRLLHLGRLDHQVKVRGFRVELGEIEAVLATHPGIAQVVVTSKTDADASQQLVAYLIAREENERPDPATLRALVRSRLPDYMVPPHVVFMDAFPQTANRKVDVPALPAPAPIAEHDTAAAPPTEPRGRLEVQLTVLWRQVLGDDTLGVHDDFFDRGGHSLKAVQLIAFLEQVTGRHLPLATLFQAPTVAEIARLLTKANWRPSWRSLVAVQPLGRAPPIFAIPGVNGNVLGFAGLSKLLGNDQPFYALQARGLDNAERPFTSIPKMAAHYASEIRSVRPRGPYIVAGACTGGVTAYEMARQLVEQGETVRLILLDTWHPKSAFRPHRSGKTLWPLRFLWLKACTYLRELAGLPLREWPEFFARKAQIARAMTARSIQDTLAISGYQVGRVVEATWIAVAAYKPQPLRCKLVNVIADANPIAPETDTRRMWEPLARGGSETLFIHAANSGRLFITPHVTELAAQLAPRLMDETGGARQQ